MPLDSPRPDPAPPADRPARPADGPGRDPSTPTDGLWIRVDPDEPDRPPAVADIESELEPLDVEVVALDAAPGSPRALQRVVDRYERLLTDRTRADGSAGGAARSPAGGLLARARALVDRLAR